MEFELPRPTGDQEKSSGRSLKVAVLTAVPYLVSTLSTRLQQMGHVPVGTIGPRRKVTAGRPPGLEAVSAPEGNPICLVGDPTEVESTLQSLRPDVMVSWGFPWRVPGPALYVPHLGSINYHPSLLPRHRGPNPIGWALRMGDERTGVTWHRMDVEYDHGRILAQKPVELAPGDDPEAILMRLTSVALRLLPGVLELVQAGDPGWVQAEDQATDAPAFTDDYLTIDWHGTARSVHNQVRAWSFSAGVRRVRGPLAVIDGTTVRVTRTSLEYAEGGNRIECADAPIWVTGFESVDE